MKKIRSLQIRVDDETRDQARMIVADNNIPLSAIVRRVIKRLAAGHDILRREDLLKEVE